MVSIESRKVIQNIENNYKVKLPSLDNISDEYGYMKSQRYRQAD